MSDISDVKAAVCVIGAGLTGLVAARRLLQAGHTVCLLESTLETGGMASAFHLGTTRVESIYHHIFTSDQSILDLLRELHLEDQLTWYQTREALYCDGRPHPFASPLDLLRFSPIPFRDRLRTGVSVLRAGRLGDWQPLEDMTAEAWLRREGGNLAYDKLWQPLLRAKFDQDSSDVSAVWIWNKFKLRGRSRGKSGVSRLGYLQGSFGLLADRLCEDIERLGGRILLGHTVMNVARNTRADGPDYRVSCILENCATVDVTADAVLATGFGKQFASITTGLRFPSDYRRRLVQQQSKGNLCLILRLRNSVTPYYWTTICDPAPFVVAVEHTQLTGPERYGGHILYLSRYLDVSDPLWVLPDGDIFRIFVNALEQLYPAFTAGQIIDWRLRRIRHAQPVIVRGYSQIMPSMNTPERGVKLAGIGQIYPEDRGMNYAVRIGAEAASAVSDYLNHLAAARRSKGTLFPPGRQQKQRI